MQEPQKAPPPVYWMGETDKCQVCQKPLRTKLVDGRLKASGQWAVLDLGCHRVHGSGVGVGKGQVYAKQENGRWLKVEG